MDPVQNLDWIGLLFTWELSGLFWNGPKTACARFFTGPILDPLGSVFPPVPCKQPIRSGSVWKAVPIRFRINVHVALECSKYQTSNLLSSSSTQSYPHAAAVSKFLSSHSPVAGSSISASAARCTPYLSPKRQMKNGAHRPILSKHMRRTCSLFCCDWLLFQRRSTGMKDVPRSRHSLFS